MNSGRAALRVVGLVALVALAPEAVAAKPPSAGAGLEGERALGRETGLPIDADILGAWVRERGPSLPAETTHFDRSGRYRRVAEGEAPEEGIWVALVRAPLRWLRRCPAVASDQVSPADCDYFGRYRLEGDEMIEEVACPDAWEGSLTGDLDFAAARKRCPTVTRKFAGVATAKELQAKLTEVAPDSAPAPGGMTVVAPGGGFSGEGLPGVWIGEVGAGPEVVRLTFSAMDGGAFYYSLEAGGQEETSSGEWVTKGSKLVLSHPDGEVETIPFTLEGNVLRWQDEDLGELVLERKG